MSEYKQLIEYFNNDNPDGDGFYLDTDQFFLDMDEYVDENGVNYYCIHAEDKMKHYNTILDVYNEDTVYIRSSVGHLLLDQNRLHLMFKHINKKNRIVENYNVKKYIDDHESIIREL